MTGSEGAGLRWGRFYLYEAYGNAGGIGVTVWDRGMGIWSAAEVSDKYANEGNKNIFLGVGKFHPLVSLQFEMEMLPVKWEAMKRSIQFWVQVMRMTNSRLFMQDGD